MSGVNLSLGLLFEQVFGYSSGAFEPEFDPVQGNVDGSLSNNFVGSRINTGATGSKYYANDALGREYYLPVTISYPETIVTSGALGGIVTRGAQSERLVDWDLPYPVLSVTSRKTIVETPLTERRGTVKELINIQDYEITIRGFIIGDTNEFPEHDVTILRNIYEVNAAIGIANPITDLFLLRPDRKNSVDKVVIKNLSFPPVTGVKNVRPYEMTLVSDEAFNLLEIV